MIKIELDLETAKLILKGLSKLPIDEAATTYTKLQETISDYEKKLSEPVEPSTEADNNKKG